MTSRVREHVKASFAAQSMMATLGARLEQAENGTARIAAPILPSAQQQHGFGHAGLTFAIGDSAAGYAALSLLDPGDEVLTTEMKINLLAPARGDRLEATGRVEKPGRRLMIVTARVEAIEGDTRTPIALLQGTMLPLRC